MCHNCACHARCHGPEDCPTEAPNCDISTGLCVGACPDVACPDPSLPNCSAEGVCVGPCEGPEDCTHPDTPNCGPDGLCFAGCTEAADCPPSLPNCDLVNGICFGPCQDAGDCLDPNRPVCDPDTGLCQGPCPTVDCPGSLPNCDPFTGLCRGLCGGPRDCTDPDLPNCGPDGLCVGPCTDSGDCALPAYPNCGVDGVCFGPCGSHTDCTLPAEPNCQLDASALDAGACGPPCMDSGDCESAAYPNCDPTPGLCLPPCTTDGDCPAEIWKCDSATGVCFLPECTQDSECNPPTTVCESWHCVPGCTAHADCASADRCDLRDPGHLNHCESRDCLSDADCAGATPVCDTDGLADPDGGGYCEPGCQTYYDCRQLGLDCDGATGRCGPHDYGDIGQPCSGGCDSGFCLTGQGNVCTGFCCVQQDCPAGWICRPWDDGTGNGHTVDVCQPASPTQGMRRFGQGCSSHDECRSGACSGGICRESCCTDEDCDGSVVPNTYCGLGGGGSPTACMDQPTSGAAPLGSLGCATTGSPSDCLSNMCFTNYMKDTACTSDAECQANYPGYPTCFDYTEVGGANGVTDCVHDMCVQSCCSSDDCPAAGSDLYFCGKWVYGPGDVNICLLHLGTATLSEGQPCSSNGACRSNLCSGSPGSCRRRCCTDDDCLDPSFPTCGLELLSVYGNSRWLNVCH